MTEPIVNCPACGTEIKLTESLAAPLLEANRKAFQEQLAQKDRDIEARETALETEQERLRQERLSIADTVTAKLKAERQAIAEEERRRAAQLLGAELEQKDKDLSEMREVLKARDSKLAEAQKHQADLLRKERELDDTKRELDLTVEKRIQEGLAEVREQARTAADDELKLKVAERDQTIGALQKQIEDLKRKADQGSQQLQGEVQELALEAVLRSSFPRDGVEPVPKGEFGGDSLQRVFSESGQPCGAILWESKRTKSWADAWLPKLRADQRAAKADVAILVTKTLPQGVDTFGLVDGVWVTAPQFAVPLAIALRRAMTELAAARQAGDGQQTKIAMTYQYLTGPRFRDRVQAIVEAFTVMREDLDKERKVITKQWAKREAQIQSVITATAGMYGDLQGIAGKSLHELKGLDMGLLEAGEPDLKARGEAEE